MSYTGYANKEKRKQYERNYMRVYRSRHKGDELRKRNRLGFLELEVERLQKSLNHALANRVSYDKAPSSEVTVKTQDMTAKRKRHFEMSKLWHSSLCA